MTDSIETQYIKGKRFFEAMAKAGRYPACSPGFISGLCAGGHRFATVQFCGREYCPDCGRDGSPIHQRRVNSFFNRSKDWAQLGYLVITIPQELRYLFLNPENLRDLRKRILRRLKERFKISQGLARWHWFGDCEPCGGAGCAICAGTGSGKNFNPHLNILFDGGFIADLDQFLKPIKKIMQSFFNMILWKEVYFLRQKIRSESNPDESLSMYDLVMQKIETIKTDDLVINYSYCSDPKNRMNKIKYVTRSTFRLWDDNIKKALNNFRNSVVWGWKKSEVQADETGHEKYCPICQQSGINKVISWTNLIRHSNNYKLSYHDITEKNGTVRRWTEFSQSVKIDYGGNDKSGTNNKSGIDGYRKRFPVNISALFL